MRVNCYSYHIFFVIKFIETLYNFIVNVGVQEFIHRVLKLMILMEKKPLEPLLDRNCRGTNSQAGDSWAAEIRLIRLQFVRLRFALGFLSQLLRVRNQNDILVLGAQFGTDAFLVLCIAVVAALYAFGNEGYQLMGL